jgi:acyl dehydratase
MTVNRFPVEATHIMMFARAIGDPNPAYVEPDSTNAGEAGGIVAPPTFAMAGAQFDDDYPLRPRPGAPWFGSGREATGDRPEGGSGLHAEQGFEYHQPMRPGMVLTTVDREGSTWQKQSRRGGTLSFVERFTEYRDAATGELVVTARMVGVTPERPVDQGERS